MADQVAVDSALINRLKALSTAPEENNLRKELMSSLFCSVNYLTVRYSLSLSHCLSLSLTVGVAVVPLVQPDQ